MKDLIDRIVINWKSTLVAIILCACTVMVYKKQMDTTDFITIMGSVGVLYGILKKDTTI